MSPLLTFVKSSMASFMFDILEYATPRWYRLDTSSLSWVTIIVVVVGVVGVTNKDNNNNM